MDGGVWLWVGLGLLILILAMGGRNECQGILFLLKRNRGHAVDFPRESHSSTGKASAGLALLWGLFSCGPLSREFSLFCFFSIHKGERIDSLLRIFFVYPFSHSRPLRKVSSDTWK